MTDGSPSELADDLLAGDQRALARAITVIENRSPGHRDLVAELYEHAGDAHVIGVTGAPGAGKSTLVDELARAYRDREATVGVIAIDPASPFTGGAVLGDRIRMGSNASDMGVFVRSMSARGALGGLSAAAGDAVTALDAFGKDVLIVETVGAGQNEIDVVRLADTVSVLVPPGSGDVIQTLKAGILEIADVFVVNKADREGVDRLVRDLHELIEEGRTGNEGRDGWTPAIVETVATEGTGVEELVETFDDHLAYLRESGSRAERRRDRQAETIRLLLREDVGDLVSREIDHRGGMEELVDRVTAGETDPYSVVEDLLGPIEDCVGERRRGDEE